MSAALHIQFSLLFLVGANFSPGPGPPCPCAVFALSEGLSPDVRASVDAALAKLTGIDPHTTARPDTPDIPQFMLDLYASSKRQLRYLDGYYRKLPSNVNTVRSFQHTEGPTLEHGTLLMFNTSIQPGEMLVSAELRLYQPAAPADNASSALRMRVRETDAWGGGSLPGRTLDNRLVQEAGERWHSVDVTATVRRWSSGHVPQHLFVQHSLTGSDYEDGSRPRLRRSPPAWSVHHPLLVTYLEDTSLPRRRNPRRANKERKKRKRNRKRRPKVNRGCARHNMSVNIKEVGWSNWILAPSKFEAFYCHGDCNYPLNDHYNSTNHAIVQSMYHSRNPTSVPRVCCVPTKLEPVTLLYMDRKHAITFREYDDMVVTECGCR